MSDVTENFRAFLLADAAIEAVVPNRVHEDHVPQGALQPFIWFRKRSATNLGATLNSANGESPDDFYFDVECVGNQEKSKTLTELVRARCNFYRGAFGDTTCKGAFVNDQDDDYFPKSIGGDSGLYVGALDVRVIL